jgi:hypothetical protein
MGIVAVSVYSNQTNCRGFSATNMRMRAELIIASIAHFQSLDSGGDPIFGGRLDFDRLGLMGHSRGGEAVVVVPEILTLAGARVRAVISLAPTDAGASSGAPRGYAFLTILPAGDGDVRDNDGAKFYDQADPSPLKCQVYLHHAGHNLFNRQWLEDESVGPPAMSRDGHERVLSAYGCALYRAVLLGHPTTAFLLGKALPAGVATENVHLSFELARQLTVDNHEDGNGIGTNSLGRPTSASGGLAADEHPFRQGAPGRFNDSFFGNTIGMVAVPRKGTTGMFRSELAAPLDVRGREIWIRTAEVHTGGALPAAATGFRLGLEDANGVVAWVDVDDVGGVPRPYDLGAADTKTMLNSLRFPAGCFRATRFDVRQVRAIRLHLNRGDQRPIAFDVLQSVTP